MTDISALSEEQRFQLLVNAVTDYAIYVLDTEGRIATWNPGAQRFKGYTAGEIIGQHYSRFFTPEDLAADLPARALRIAAREGRFEAEGWRVRKDGTRFRAHVVLDPIRSPEGKLLGFAKITRDITEKHQQERELFEIDQRFRLLVQGVKDYAIYMLDREGRVTNWNSGAELIKGYKADEIVGQHFSRFYSEADRAAGEPERALRTALGEGKYEREAWRVRKDGSLFWASVVIDPIFDEAGEHVGFAKITRDVTDRKRAQDELEEARIALAQSQKLQALGELTGGIAHDFNNLMTVIAGSADFLLRRPDLPDEKRLQYLKAIAETTQRATRLTDHLLAFGRRRPIRPEVIDVNRRVEAFHQVLARTLGSKIKVELDLAPDVGAVEVDVAQLETAILNAVVNARDAMPGGGTLTIVSSVVGDEVRIAVRDTGLGMPQRIIERAFEPFFTTKEVGKGTGLGLSQIHGFAAQAGGRAEIESQEGAGTTVSIVLPRSSKAPAPEETLRPATTIPRGLRVLLVEDNEEVRVFAADLLEEMGCAVTSAAGGDQALACIHEADVDLVLTDIVMPGMSGVELASRLKELRPDLPVVLASGYSDEVARTGATANLITKPYGAREIGEAFAAALARHDDKAA